MSKSLVISRILFRESVNEVQKHLWLGALFASIIVFFFSGTCARR